MGGRWVDERFKGTALFDLCESETTSYVVSDSIPAFASPPVPEMGNGCAGTIIICQIGDGINPGWGVMSNRMNKSPRASF